MPPQLAVCYLSALDERWIDPTHCPFIHRQLQHHPAVPLHPQPNTQLTPTLVTGVGVDQHKGWQMTLRPRRPRTPIEKLIDLLPDALTTTAQCLHHRFDRYVDLPTVEPRRRRQFELYRYKLTRKEANPKQYIQSFGGVPTIFSMLGDRSFYQPMLSLEHIEEVVPHIDPAKHDLTFLHLYGYDIFLHWVLDQTDVLIDATRRVDRAIEALHTRCVEAGVPLLLFSDHGQEIVTGTVDILSLIQSLGLTDDDFTYYCEVPCARFWFHTPEAEQTVRRALAELDHVTLIDADDMPAHNMPIKQSDGFGDLFVFTDAGHVFFPHDFHHPVINRYMALTRVSHRARKHDPVHRGYHGHLPHEACENGFITLLNPAAAAASHVPAHAPVADSAELVDIAPTILDLLGENIPAHMTGQPRTLTRTARHHAA